MGLRLLKLKPGSASAKLLAKGKGSNLDDFGALLPLNLPLRVQLQHESATCWEATYSASGARKNQAGLFLGKSD